MSRYYSVQSVDLWNKIKNKKYFKNSSKHICDESFRDAYKWMKSELKQHIGSENIDSSMIWMWTEKPNIETLAQDGHLEEGKNGVLLEIDIDDSLVLKSDFELWHYVLLDVPISDNVFEPEDLKLKSWKKIFELTGESDVQAVTSKLKTKDMKVLCEFVSEKCVY